MRAHDHLRARCNTVMTGATDASHNRLPCWDQEHRRLLALDAPTRSRELVSQADRVGARLQVPQVSSRIGTSARRVGPETPFAALSQRSGLD